MKHLRLTPIYCPNCHGLTLLHPNGLVDAKLGRFMEHSCKLLDGKKILESEWVQNWPRISEETQTYPIDPKKLDSSPAKNLPKAAIVLGWDDNGNLKCLGVDNRTYAFKAMFEQPVHPGQVIRLNEAQRIGHLRYRLPKLSLLVPPEDLSTLAELPEGYYQINLHGRDVNQLEGITEQLVQTCIKLGVTPFAVTSQPITEEGHYSRRIDLNPTAEVLSRITVMALPDAVEFSIKQVQLD